MLAMTALPAPKPRALLLPSEATTEGVRILRELLRRQTSRAVARRVGVPHSTVLRWAREEFRPLLPQRARAVAALGIPEAAWDEAARGGSQRTPLARRPASAAPGRCRMATCLCGLRPTGPTSPSPGSSCSTFCAR